MSSLKCTGNEDDSKVNSRFPSRDPRAFLGLCILSGFFLQSFHEFFVRGAGDDSIKLRAIIVDNTDVLHHHVINFPLTIVLPQFIDDRDLLPLGRNDGRFDLVKILIYHLTAEPYFFAAIEIDLIRIDSFQKIPEQFDKLLLLRRSSPSPMSAEGALGHLLVIKNWVKCFSQALD